MGLGLRLDGILVLRQLVLRWVFSHLRRTRIQRAPLRNSKRGINEADMRILTWIAASYLTVGTAFGGFFWYASKGGWDCLACAKASAQYAFLWGWYVIEKWI